jgi:hypothetical protein
VAARCFPSCCRTEPNLAMAGNGATRAATTEF